MLPGKAMGVPRLRRLRMRLAAKATPTPYQGPKQTAQTMLTMCWTGAHWEPSTGKEKRLPTTATAVSRPAAESFLTRV